MCRKLVRPRTFRRPGRIRTPPMSHFPAHELHRVDFSFNRDIILALRSELRALHRHSIYTIPFFGYPTSHHPPSSPPPSLPTVLAAFTPPAPSHGIPTGFLSRAQSTSSSTPRSVRAEPFRDLSDIGCRLDAPSPSALVRVALSHVMYVVSLSHYTSILPYSFPYM